MLGVLCVLLCAIPAEAAPTIPTSAYQDLHWRMIGPFRGGRTRAVAGVASQPNVFYMAQVNGGVWKTDDHGRTWRPIFDDQPTQSIGALAVAPSNPNIIYAGSGEGLHRPDLSVGDGVYKSIDAGKTWKHVGLADAQQIPQIVVDPKNPDRVFAAVLGHPYGANEQRGIFRSLDGGKSWDRVLYKNPNVGASDVEIDPTNPDIVYAALLEERLAPWEDKNEYAGTGGGLFKSSDGGKSWRQLAGGLPKNAVQLDVAIAPSRTSRLYVTLATTEESEYGSGKGNGLYRSDDAGATWTSVTTDDRPLSKIGGGDLMVPVVDPKNPDLVYVASIVAMKSADAGKTWTWLRGAPGGDDYQNLWINPRDPNTILLVSDQGAVVTVNGGQTWSSWYNQPTAQLYHVSVTADVPYRVCSGQQESGSVCIASRGDYGTITARDWRPVGVSEYGYAAADPRNPDVVYGAGRNQVSRYQWSTGQVQNVTPIPVRGKHRVERTQPIVFSPIDPRILYYAAEVLFRSTNGGQSWQTISPDLSHPKPGLPASVGTTAAADKESGDHRGAIYALAPSFKSVTTIWAGTDDGKLWLTRDAKRWTDVTPPTLLPWSKVTQLDASHFDDVTVYASVSRLRVDDLAPYIFKTHDGGKTWTQITQGLPPGPVNAVRADPIRKGLLYASTETAVWVSFDDGVLWQPLQLNLPHSSARDILVHGNDLIVATHGRGFWILDDISSLRQLAVAMPDTLFKPAPAYRMPRSTYPDTPVPPDEPYAENPPSGAVIDYFLAQAATAPVTLEIADARGTVIRTYSSADLPELSAAELAKQLIPPYWVRPHRALATTAGMHRWVWDLRGEQPIATRYGYPINAVPHDTPRAPEGVRVLPGTYRVKLTANGKSVTQTVDVKLDPRVKLSTAAVTQQHAAEVRLAELVSRSSKLLLGAQSVMEQLAKLPPQPLLAPTAITVTSVLSGVKLPPGLTLSPQSDPPPTLTSVSGKLGSLYEAIEVDAAPTAAQLAEIAQAERELATLSKRWDAVKSTELAQLNASLAASKQPPINPDLRPQSRQSAGDEE